jgi:PAS domain S-box-containing protein
MAASGEPEAVRLGEALAQEDLQRVVLSSIGDAVLTADLQGNVTFLNSVGQSLTGWTLEEAVGVPLDQIFRIVNEETRLPVENPAFRALRDGMVAGLANHTLLIAKDGTERPIDDSAAPIRDARGEVTGVVLVFRDISERRRAERLIQDARTYAESIVATVREPLVVLTADLRVKTANRSFYQTFQVTPEETEGEFIDRLGNGQWDIPPLRRLLRDVLPRNAAFHDYVVDHVFPDIGHRFMLLNARRVYGGDTELILLAIEDVTARKRAEDAKRELESRYTSLVQNIKDHSVFMMDTAGCITSWNVAAEKIIGYTEDEILGRHFSIIFTPDDLEGGLPEQELRLAREEGRAEDERWHVRKDGELFWAFGIVTPMLDAQGNLAGYSKILRDITERKRAEELLNRQSEALREADRRKNEFLAMLSHELRNPMAPIRNSAQVIRLLGSVDPNVQRAAEMIERQVGQMTRLVDDLLDVSRIASGKVRLQKELIELSTVVASAVETSRPLIDRRRHQLTVNLCPEPVLLHGDMTRLSQVLANILNNAAKYTEEGGRINLTVELGETEAAVRVRDDGMGIPPETLPHIFDLFAQGDRSLARSEGGLGIGLSLVKELVEMHGGRVEAFSGGRGRGSEFVVRLPVLPSSGLADELRPMVTPTQPDQALHVLVVDDNVDSADSLATLLRMSGHRVRQAYSGPAALEAVAQHRPNVVLLDIGLPDIDGYEVARRLRQRPELADVRLVAVTGYGQDNDLQRSREAGFAAHLVKPVDLRRLQEILTALAE